MAKSPVKKKVADKPALAKAGSVKAAAWAQSKPGVKAAAAKKLAAKPGAENGAKAGSKAGANAVSRPEAQAAATPFPKAPALPRAVQTAGPEVLDRLFGVVVDRRDFDPALSHSARLLSRGPAKVAQKFGEEAVECLIEAVRGDKAALVGESADTLYHLVVMWVSAGITPEQVWAELQRREGMSGVEEKASRVPGETTKIP